MPNDVRDLPASNDGLSRFLGGTPLAVAFRLVLLSILVGVVLAAIGFDPWNILNSIRLLFQRLWDLGFDAINWVWRYFLLGAVIVVPIWLLTRIFGTRAGASQPWIISSFAETAGSARGSRCNCNSSAAAMRSAPAGGPTPVFMSPASAAIS